MIKNYDGKEEEEEDANDDEEMKLNFKEDIKMF